MQAHTENTDQIGPYYKKRLEELAEVPDNDVKNSLFSKMDILEGKRPKTIYLHVNLFGMKIAASITMLVVSSLALMAAVAVTVIAVRNNTKKSKAESPDVIIPQLPEGRKSILKPTYPQLHKPEEIHQNTVTGAPSLQVPDEIKEPAEKEEMFTVPDISKPVLPAENVTPVQKSGDNSKLLNEIDKEEDLFKK